MYRTERLSAIQLQRVDLNCILMQEKYNIPGVLGTNESKACAKRAASSTDHSKQRNLIWTLLHPLVPLTLIFLFIKGDLSSHPQDWKENTNERSG